MNTPKIKAVLFKSKTYKDGSHPIMIRVTQDRKLIYKSVGHSVVLDAWDDDNQCVYDRAPKITKRQEAQLKPDKLAELKERYKHAIVLHNASTINSDIEDKLAEVSGISHKLKVNEEIVDLKSIKKGLTNDKTGDRNKSFLVFGGEYRDAFLTAGSVGTYKSYKTTLVMLDEYLNHKDLLFSDLTVQFLNDYNAHLQASGSKTNTIHKHLKCIRAIYYSAIAQQLITAEGNPFFVFKLKIDKNIKKDKLNVEEIISIEQATFDESSLIATVRDFFLFSFYCAGIRASDLLQLKWDNINKQGRLEYRMDKTGHHKSITLIPKAMAILNRYKPSKVKDDMLVFPFLNIDVDLTNGQVLHNQISSCTALINKYLKQVAEKAKVDKVLTTHIARHSFADIARSRKTSIYDISKMLGHSSIKVTEAYLASFDVDSQDEAMKSIMDY